MRRAALFAITAGLTACSLFLDFDLSGSSPPGDEASTSNPTTDGGDGGGGPSNPTGDSGAVYPPIETDFVCGNFVLCDGFEDRTTPIGGIFQLSDGTMEISRRRPYSQQQALELVRPRTPAGGDRSLLARQDSGFPDGRGRISLEFAMQLEPELPATQSAANERVLVFLIASPQIDDRMERPRLKLVINASGIFLKIRQFGGGADFIDQNLTTENLGIGEYVKLRLEVDFRDGAVQMFRQERELFNLTGLTLLNGPLPANWSIGFGAQAQNPGTGPVTVRYDHIRINPK